MGLGEGRIWVGVEGGGRLGNYWNMVNVLGEGAVSHSNFLIFTLPNGERVGVEVGGTTSQIGEGFRWEGRQWVDCSQTGWGGRADRGVDCS